MFFKKPKTKLNSMKVSSIDSPLNNKDYFMESVEKLFNNFNKFDLDVDFDVY